jgi:hypothetical protein
MEEKLTYLIYHLKIHIEISFVTSLNIDRTRAVYFDITFIEIAGACGV